MKTLGSNIFIQRGETWSLDFEVTNDKNDPYMLFREWKNPFLAITVTAARYEQEGDFRKTWWLDLNERLVEQFDGTYKLEPIKRFTETEALYIQFHMISQVLATYGIGTYPSGRIILDKESPFDITNYLFFVDNNADNKRIYKYVKDYEVDIDGNLISETWEEYNFRIIKQFDTREWTEQNYLFDIKVLTGESLSEYINKELIKDNTIDIMSIPSLPWTDTITMEQIKRITDKKIRKEVQSLFDDGWPLMPSFDTKSLLLQPTKLTVSANIMGGFKNAK